MASWTLRANSYTRSSWPYGHRCDGRLHVPTIELVLAGDTVYGDVHLYLAEAEGNGTAEWLDALDVVEKLQPAAVVAGHRCDDETDSPENIGRTRGYIQDFAAEVASASTFTDLYEAMVARYPDRTNRVFCGTRQSSSCPRGAIGIAQRQRRRQQSTQERDTGLGWPPSPSPRPKTGVEPSAG